ncbi:MAG: outer membrane lipoprotein-sorting protein [Ignavibacteria bacterium]
MRKLIFTFITFSIIFFNGAEIYSQTVDEIIENHAKAIGGADKLNSITSLKMSGKYSTGGFDVPMTFTLKRGGKARLDISYQGMNLIKASDETTGWSVNPFRGNTEAVRMPAEELKAMTKYTELEGKLIGYKEKGYKVEYLGKDDFEGSEVFKLKLTDKDGDKTYYFMDVTSNLILMESSKRKIKEKEIKSRTVYGGYQSIGGIMFPMTMEVIEGDRDAGDIMIIENVETNVNVDDGIFKMPK